MQLAADRGRKRGESIGQCSGVSCVLVAMPSASHHWVQYVGGVTHVLLVLQRRATIHVRRRVEAAAAVCVQQQQQQQQQCQLYRSSNSNSQSLWARTITGVTQTHELTALG